MEALLATEHLMFILSNPSADCLLGLGVTVKPETKSTGRPYVPSGVEGFKVEFRVTVAAMRL